MKSFASRGEKNRTNLFKGQNRTCLEKKFLKPHKTQNRTVEEKVLKPKPDLAKQKKQGSIREFHKSRKFFNLEIAISKKILYYCNGLIYKQKNHEIQRGFSRAKQILRIPADNLRAHSKGKQVIDTYDKIAPSLNLKNL